MDSPPAIEPPFEPESIAERLLALEEMFPETLRNIVSSTINSSIFGTKWAFNKTRSVLWFVTSTAAILMLPLSIELERQEYQEQSRKQERQILLGPV